MWVVSCRSLVFSFVFLKTGNYLLPRRFLYSRYFAVVCKLTKTNAAQIKIAHIATLATATKTAVCCPRAEFCFFSRSRDNRCFCHNNSKPPDTYPLISRFFSSTPPILSRYRRRKTDQKEFFLSRACSVYYQTYNYCQLKHLSSIS